MDSEKTSKIEQFKNLTGADDSRAQFYLESAAWQLEVAIESFFDGGDNNEDDDDDDVVIDDERSAAAFTQPARTSRVTTFSSFQQGEKDDDEEEGQMFYAGGSEHSGQNIVGPPRKKTNEASDDIIQNMFKAAKEHGAEEVGASESSPNKPRKTKFKGTGYRLGETANDSTTIPGGPSAEAEEIHVTITFWKDGFSVDDGPIRDFMDKDNKPFLDSIARGEIPMELLKRAKGGEVNVNMVDKRGEEYVKPKVHMKAFGGKGQMLGSPAPSVVVKTNTAEDSMKKNQDAAQNEISVDASQPTTQIQIRLSDGSRLVAKLNLSHTVSDIRRYICTARPEFASTTFVLMTTFPKKELTDNAVTISDANLQNAVIVLQMR